MFGDLNEVSFVLSSRQALNVIRSSRTASTGIDIESTRTDFFKSLFRSIFDYIAIYVSVMATSSNSATVQSDVHYRQRFVLGVTTVLMILSSLAVILRLTARGLTHQRLRSNDIFMILTLQFSYIDGICQYLGKESCLV